MVGSHMAVITLAFLAGKLVGIGAIVAAVSILLTPSKQNSI
jgi:hypothetical protein